MERKGRGRDSERHGGSLKRIRSEPGQSWRVGFELNDAEAVVTSLAIPILSGGNYVQRDASPLSISSRYEGGQQRERERGREKERTHTRGETYGTVRVRHVHRERRFLRFRFPARERPRRDWLPDGSDEAAAGTISFARYRRADCHLTKLTMLRRWCVGGG